MNDIVIRGARENNLQNVNLVLPRGKFIVMTGLSGSGKSSLAFETLYAEGQRRYVESLSAYARQFLGQMDKPDVDSIEGLSPAISIDQKTTSRNPRSTVGTVTEIHDYLRLLYARVGTPHCPKCGRVIAQQTVDQMVDAILAIPERTRIQVLAPIARGRKGEYVKQLDDLRKQGYTRAKIDGEVYDLAEAPTLNKQKKHDISVVVDRLTVRPDVARRLADSLESALKLGEGLAIIDAEGAGETMLSQNYACPDCGISIGELQPRLFSFNSPFGACPDCTGLGTMMKVDPDLVVPDKTLSLKAGAVKVSGWSWLQEERNSIATMFFDAIAKHYGADVDTPWRDLPEAMRQCILYGSGDVKFDVHYLRENGSGSYNTAFEGIIPNLERRWAQTSSDGMKEVLAEMMSEVPCETCRGTRYKPEALAVTVGDHNIAEVSVWPIADTRAFFESLELTQQELLIAQGILREIDARLGFLVDVGLDYLTLSRSAGSLSGGEAQRIRLATQIGSHLVGVLYILDEPSIGLHQRDNQRLIGTLRKLRDLDNTLIVVEHDEETMRAADHIVDIGPGAGAHGGKVVAQGTLEDILACPESLTGLYLSGKRAIHVPKKRRKPTGSLTVRGARANNLKGITVRIPLGVITCVTGVSGSGKSSLINEVLRKTLARDLNRARTKPGPNDGIDGLEQLDKVVDIDQSPIGRTPRSNPATYTGVFDLIREVFAATPDARTRGYRNGRFSFNVKGGRCEACAGDGIIRIEMHFLPDVYVPCEVCKGRRYNRETLEVKYKGKSIGDVLDMRIEEAVDFFEAIPRISAKLKTLNDVGLGYLKLGHPSTALSGGEAQRVKLATELSRRSTGRTMYILDEPTTGLHMADVDKLVAILQQLAEGGNSVVVIEHNLDVIKVADCVIDMGPEGGAKGGTIVAEGTPEEVAAVSESYTGQFLKHALGMKV